MTIKAEVRESFYSERLMQKGEEGHFEGVRSVYFTGRHRGDKHSILLDENYVEVFSFGRCQNRPVVF